ncbi:bacteriophage abortive infection AbiH family protein [Sphingomonas sp. GB1N7]|uniref:bacteriophage abortive infection AbiH family protein n=1 Tax=Parasphingomonas caseinilytica TaxID=3096158 RepID=UPI002FC9627B
MVKRSETNSTRDCVQRLRCRRSQLLRARFGEWIRQLTIPTPASFPGPWIRLDPAALYLTFNYTPTLQRLYGIPEAHVLHIHGSAAKSEDQLVLGHGWEPGLADPYRFESDPENADMRVIEGIEIVDGYFKDTFKPTVRIIEAYRQNFAALADVTDIIVMGHSLAEVDHPYFEAIIAKIDIRKVRWRVSVYGDLDYKTNCMSGFGIAPHLVHFGCLSEL